MEFRVTDGSNGRRYCANHPHGRPLAVQAAEYVPVDPEVERKYERQVEENKSLRQALAQARQEEDSAERIRESIFKIAGHSPEPPNWLHQPTKGGAPGVPATTWSDWHWGETVKREEVGGVNEFNTEIGIARAQRLTKAVIDLCFAHMVSPEYPGIVVNLGGDMITGDIHEELQDTNDRYTFQSILELQDYLAGALTALADQFGHVFVPSVVGNHGRNTKKPRMKGRVYTSFEWLLYCELERYFENDDRVQLYVPGDADAHYRIYDKRYMLTHGDSLGVKGGDGIIGSLGPIMRGAVKVGRSEAQIGRDFDHLIMGHWHTYMTLPGVNVNGSLKGYDEYAHLGLRAPYQEPIQALWFTHQKYGITAQWPIYLEEKQKVDSAGWVSWPRQ